MRKSTVTDAPPYPHAHTAIAKCLAARIDELAGVKTQRQIASEVGYSSPNLISMFKRGESKVPFEKIPALARALNLDPAHLFRLAVEQYWPEDNAAISEIFGAIVSSNETAILNKIRHLTANRDPALSADLETKLSVAFRE